MYHKNHSFISFILISFIILLNLICVLASLSGIYVDNGNDQTMLHHALDNEDKQEVEHEILELLGLPDRPRKRHIHPSMRKSAPQFLLDIYHRLAEENNGGEHSRSTRSADSDNLITEIDKRAIEQSDIIMTFLNKNHHVSEVRHERGRRLWFDTSEIGTDVSLMMAELRLYIDPSLSKYREDKRQITLSVSTITRSHGVEKLEVLSAINTTSDYQGWLEMNVTEALLLWTHDKTQNKGLYISATFLNRPEHEIKLDDIGLVNTKGNDEYQPFMVGFFNGQEIIKPTKHSHSRVKRNTGKRRKKSDPRNPLLYHPDDHHKSCQIHTLYVSFKDLKWQDWIIAPDGYGAFYCSGECNFPLNSHMNGTNHAIVQTLVHLFSPAKVPKPCCAPTKLSPISVLYFLDDSNVNLKKYKNMVVKSCGCH